MARRNMSPSRAAFTRFDDLPGWRTRGMVRALMLHHVAGTAGATTTMGKAPEVFELLARCVTDESDAVCGRRMRRALPRVRRMSDAEQLHDSLGDVDEMLYLREFAVTFERHGLQCYGEADLASKLLADFPTEVTERLHRPASDAQRMEPSICPGDGDFLRRFRAREFGDVSIAAARSRSELPPSDSDR